LVIRSYNFDMSDIAIELTQQEPLEVKMGTIVSLVPELLQERGWTVIDLVRRGLSINTSYRLARGETGVTIETARQLCGIFGVKKLDDIFRYAEDEQEQDRD